MSRIILTDAGRLNYVKSIEITWLVQRPSQDHKMIITRTGIKRVPTSPTLRYVNLCRYPNRHYNRTDIQINRKDGQLNVARL